MPQPSQFVITLTGDFDIYSQHRLADALLPADDHPFVVVDFSAVNYVDSTALSVLVRMRNRRAAKDYPCERFAGVNEQLRRILEITGLDTIWPVFGTLEDALNG